MLLSSGPGTVPELVVDVVSVAAVLPVPVGGGGGFGFGRGVTSTVTHVLTAPPIPRLGEATLSRSTILPTLVAVVLTLNDPPPPVRVESAVLQPWPFRRCKVTFVPRSPGAILPESTARWPGLSDRSLIRACSRASTYTLIAFEPFVSSYQSVPSEANTYVALLLRLGLELGEVRGVESFTVHALERRVTASLLVEAATARVDLSGPRRPSRGRAA